MENLMCWQVRSARERNSGGEEEGVPRDEPVAVFIGWYAIPSLLLP
jgi:hypothetical protein